MKSYLINEKIVLKFSRAARPFGNIFALAFAVFASMSLSTAEAVDIFWNNTGGTSWLTASNWGGTIPDSTDVALFAQNPSGSSTVGISMSGGTNNGAANQAVGAIEVTALRLSSIVINNSSSSVDGTLTLNGSTLNGISDVILRNTSGVNLTIANGSSRLMALALGDSTANVVSVESSGNIIISSNITGSGKALTLNAASNGDLRLSGSNSYDGGTNITGGSGGGRLRIDSVAALPNIGTVAISSGGRLTLNAAGTYGGILQALTLNPNQTNNPSLDILSDAAVIWQGSLSVDADTRIDTNGNGSLTFSGNASGIGTLIKQAAGNLILSGTGNNLTGGTFVGSGTITVNQGSSMGSGALTFAQNSGSSTSVILNNEAQTVAGLFSTWSQLSGTQTQTLTLNGTAFTVNQSIDGTFGRGSANTLTSIIAGSGTIIKQGAATLTLGIDNTFTGKTVINSGFLAGSGEGIFGLNPTVNVADQITLNGGGIKSIGGSLNFSSNRGLMFGANGGMFDTSGGDITLTNALSGSLGGALTKIGNNALISQGVHTYDGATNIQQGVLQLASGNDRLPTGTTVNLGQSGGVNLGVFDLNGRNQQIAGLNSIAGSNSTASNNTVTSTGAAVLTISGSGTYNYGDGTNANSGIISGAITLNKAGAGTQVLGDLNTYTGSTNINSGILSVGRIVVSSGSSNLGNSTSAVSLGDSVNQGALYYTGGTAVYTRGFTINAGGGGLINDGSGLLTLQSGGIVVSGIFNINCVKQDVGISSAITGIGGLRKTGSNTLTIFGTNTYTGTTTIDEGILKLAGSNALGGGVNSTSSVTVSASGSSLDLAGVSPSASVNLALNGTGINGGGALMNSSVTASSYSGLISMAGDTRITSASGNILLTNTGVITGPGFNLTLDGASTGSILASIIGTGAGGLTKQGSGAWTLTGASTYNGVTTIRNGTLLVGVSDLPLTSGAFGSASSPILLADADSGLADNVSLLLGAFTLNRNIIVQNYAASGDVIIGNNTGTSTFSGALTLERDVTLTSSGTKAIFTGQFSGVGNIHITGMGNTVQLANSTTSNTYAGVIFVDSGTLNLSKGASGVGDLITGNVTVASGAIFSESAFSNQIADTALITVSGAYSMSSSSNETIGGLNINGGEVNTSSSTLTLSANAVNSDVLTMNGGIITLGSAGTAGRLRLNGNLLVNSSSNLALIDTTIGTANTSSLQLADLGSGNRIFNVGLGTGNALGRELTVASIISNGSGGIGGLTKAGVGTMVLSGLNTYTGPTVVSSGVLYVSGSIINSAVTVQSGGTLGTSSGLSGGTTGRVDVQSGGILAPGIGAGIMTVNGDLNIENGGVFFTEINGIIAGIGYDQLSVNGGGVVSLGNAVDGYATLSLSGVYIDSDAASDLFFILLNDGGEAIGGIFNGLGEGSHVYANNGQEYIISYQADYMLTNIDNFGSSQGNDIALLSVSAAPEPSSSILLLGGLVFILRARKRTAASH